MVNPKPNKKSNIIKKNKYLTKKIFENVSNNKNDKP